MSVRARRAPRASYRKSDGDACREPEATRATGDKPTRKTGLWYGLTTARKEELKQLAKVRAFGVLLRRVCPELRGGNPALLRLKSSYFT